MFAGMLGKGCPEHAGRAGGSVAAVPEPSLPLPLSARWVLQLQGAPGLPPCSTKQFYERGFHLLEEHRHAFPVSVRSVALLCGTAL